jgi:hypothetical protein
MAYRRALEFAVMWGLLLIAEEMALLRHFALAGWSVLLAICVWINFFTRMRKSHSGFINEMLAVFGLPMFSWLLLRSATAHQHHAVWWKGREYSGFESTLAEVASDVANPAGQASAAKSGNRTT